MQIASGQAYGRFSLHPAPESEERETRLERFGRHTNGIACIYYTYKPSGIDIGVLKELVRYTVKTYRNVHPVETRLPII